MASVLPDDWAKTPDAHGWVPPDAEYRTYIVCAANRSPEGLIFCGSRHGSNAMFALMQAAGVSYRDTDDGFIDQFDRWWSREEAYAIMKLTKQPMLYEGKWGEDLYSENLY